MKPGLVVINPGTVRIGQARNDDTRCRGIFVLNEDGKRPFGHRIGPVARQAIVPHIKAVHRPVQHNRQQRQVPQGPKEKQGGHGP